MRDIRDVLTQRRSIRRYTREKLTAEHKDFIYEAIRLTPTSYNGQQFSVVAIENQTTKEALYEITGQKQIKTSALFLVFCVDYHKITVAAQAKGIVAPHYAATIDGYTVGVVDASMAMMNACVAAEAQGLGCCCVGYTRTSDPARISQILQLPKDVAIVCGLAIGFPNEQPDLKPKQPVSIVVHSETYTSDNDLRRSLTDYDAVVSKYNQERAGDQTSNDWASHIVEYHVKEMNHSIANYLENQIGLVVEHKE